MKLSFDDIGSNVYYQQLVPSSQIEAQPNTLAFTADDVLHSLCNTTATSTNCSIRNDINAIGTRDDRVDKLGKRNKKKELMIQQINKYFRQLQTNNRRRQRGRSQRKLTSFTDNMALKLDESAEHLASFCAMKKLKMTIINNLSTPARYSYDFREIQWSNQSVRQFINFINTKRLRGKFSSTVN